ncbi:hypothetical protein B0G71_7553 [Paraburkholderia sp. BL27I4N3]|nr:hypothetical protein B0G71_7553 [Paraburkholderia sp. BL27I4N3]
MPANARDSVNDKPPALDHSNKIEALLRIVI